MPILSVIKQPAADSLKAAYRPIILSVEVGRWSTGTKPEVVFCDIYIDDIYYATVSSSVPDRELMLELYHGIIPSEPDRYYYKFDISRRVQEVLSTTVPDFLSKDVFKNVNTCKTVSCKFRDTTLDSNGFQVGDPSVKIPVQGTYNTNPVPGDGFQSNKFYAVNAILRPGEVKGLADHLSFFKQGNWSPDAFPLSEKQHYYPLTRTQNAFFPFLYTGTKCFSKVKFIYDTDTIPGRGHDESFDFGFG